MKNISKLEICILFIFIFDPNSLKHSLSYFHCSLETRQIDKHEVHFLSLLFSRFWIDARIVKPLLTFLVIYVCIMLTFFFVWPNCPKDEYKKAGEWKGDYEHCENATFTQQMFKREVKQVADAHKSFVKVITFVLGFYVGTMMRRWWSQISKLPDITQVAMALNGFVEPNPNDPEEVTRAKKLKHDILRYCMLSYSLLMIEITRPSTTPKVFVAKIYGFLSRPFKRNRLEIDKRISLENVLDQNLLLPHEQSFFVGKDMDKYWWLPLHWACKKVQTNRGMIDSSYEVVNALKDYQHNLYSLLEYHMNPFPNICNHAVYIAAWVYLLMSTYASQSVDKVEGTHSVMGWLWICLGVSIVILIHIL